LSGVHASVRAMTRRRIVMLVRETEHRLPRPSATTGPKRHSTVFAAGTLNAVRTQTLYLSTVPVVPDTAFHSINSRSACVATPTEVNAPDRSRTVERRRPLRRRRIARTKSRLVGRATPAPSRRIAPRLRIELVPHEPLRATPGGPIGGRRLPARFPVRLELMFLSSRDVADSDPTPRVVFRDRRHRCGHHIVVAPLMGGGAIFVERDFVESGWNSVRFDNPPTTTAGSRCAQRTRTEPRFLVSVFSPTRQRRFLYSGYAEPPTAAPCKRPFDIISSSGVGVCAIDVTGRRVLADREWTRSCRCLASRYTPITSRVVVSCMRNSAACIRAPRESAVASPLQHRVRERRRRPSPGDAPERDRRIRKRAPFGNAAPEW